MKKITILLLIFCFSFLPPAPAEVNFSSVSGLAKLAPEKPLPWPAVGESLIFDVSWMGIPVGTGTLFVKEKVRLRGHQAYHVIAVAQTNNFLSKIYPVRDEIHSFIDAEKFHSLEFSKKLKEGRYRADERVIYDHAAKKGFYESFHNKSKKEFEIPYGVHDLVSVFYWFRTQQVPVGQSAKAVVNSEEQNWDFEAKVLKRETKELRNYGTVDALLVEPRTRLKGALYKRGRALVYFATDEKRTPVVISLQTPFGAVVGVLRAH